MKKTCVIMVSLVLSSTAYGMVYRWTDTRGIRHYTNKEYEIPARYRAKAKALYPEQGDITAPLQQNTQQAQPDIHKPPPDQQAKPDIHKPAPAQQPTSPAQQPALAHKKAPPRQSTVQAPGLAGESMKEHYLKTLQGKGKHRY